MTTPADDRRTRAAEAAARNVPNNPHPLCRDFVEQPEPSAFWCGRCHWNRPMHDDEIAREAISKALDRLPARAVNAATHTTTA
jgi:hypothetical protein